MKNKTYFSTILAIFLLIFWAGCRSDKKQTQKVKKIPVKLAVVEQKEMARVLHTYGRLATKKEIKLSFKINGIIEKILIDEGQSVKKGQLLARLDLSEIDAQVKQARSSFQKAERDLERAGNLYKEKAATLEQFQNIQTAFQVAQSQLKIAEFNLRFSEIRAPSKGRILKRLVEENELVGAGMSVFFFASTDKDWIVRVGVSDSDLVRLKLKDPASVTFDAYPGLEFRASVSEIVESADPMTGTYEIELKVDARERRLVSGFVAKVDIFPSSKSCYAIIPIDALVEADRNHGYVYTVNNDSKTARRIPVTIGFLFEDKVAVVSGLDKITHVVTEGAPYLSDGAEVEIILHQGNFNKEIQQETREKVEK